MNLFLSCCLMLLGSGVLACFGNAPPTPTPAPSPTYHAPDPGLRTVSDDQASPHTTHLKAGGLKASRWTLGTLIPRATEDHVTVTHVGTQPADVWAYRRTSAGTVLEAVRVARDLAPGEDVTVDLTRLFEASDGLIDVASVQALSVDRDVSTANETGVPGTVNLRVQAKNNATSTRDERGVWFIKGGTLYEAMEMMGYNVAVDRLWQAEIFRRTGRGRLAEFFGPDLASQDVAVRTTGYSEDELIAYFEDSHPDTKDAFNGYVDGINRRIAEVNADGTLLPFEFRALGLSSVESWSVPDVMAWVSLLQRNFSSLGNLGFGQVQNGLDLLDLVAAKGPWAGVNMFADLSWRNDPGAPTMVPADAGKRAVDPGPAEAAALFNLVSHAKKAVDTDALRAMLEQRQATYDRNTALLKKVGGFVKGGSYAWAVAGHKTVSGNPTVYSGPQMGFSAPAIVTEGSIESPDLTVSGMTVPGIPAIIIGRTPHHAWSMQVGHTPTWDFYQESPESVSLHHVETVHVAGGDDIQVPVFRTEHGPVVAQEPFVLSWKYSGWGREWRLAEGNIALARAESMDAFGEAIANLAVTQHFTYADRDGNIAYWMSGFHPVRPAGEYRLPQGLLAAPLEWQGFHPPTHDANTPQGFYTGWNNQATTDYVDTSGTYRYGLWHRAIVPQTIVRNSGLLSYDDIKEVAVQIAATQAFESGSGSGGGNLWTLAADRFAAAVGAHPTEARTAALQMMQAWDGQYIAGGPDAWVFGTDIADAWYLIDRWMNHVLDLTFEDDIPGMAGRSTRLNVLLRELVPNAPRKNQYRLWARNFADPDAPQTWDDIIVAGLDAALAELGPAPWGEGKRGTLTYENLLGLPIPETPWGARSTYAHIVEYGPDGPTRIESMFPLGESGFIGVDAEGNPVFDPHYFSMKAIYDGFSPRPFPDFDGDQ